MSKNNYKIEDVRLDLDIISGGMCQISREPAPLNVKTLRLIFTLKKFLIETY